MSASLFTIGFTKCTAEQFFETLRVAEVRRVIDVRLKTSSQLAGFAKGRDLPYFLRAIASIEYHHEPLLAPTPELLEGYKKGRVSWERYVEVFGDILERRRVATVLEPRMFENACLLCSEPTADRCHRRLVAEHFAECWGELEVVHLVNNERTD
jgi:uncharacterized protein (DUF488 family)